MLCRCIPPAPLYITGPEIFEGLKAYRRADGGVQLFRPMETCPPHESLAARLCLPTINEQDMLQALTTFVEVEQDWTPHSQGTSLYIRPFMFGNDENLGVHAVTPRNVCHHCLSQRQLLQRGHQPG